jgi:hypothetical protein
LGSDDNCQKILGSKPAQEWILMWQGTCLTGKKQIL